MAENKHISELPAASSIGDSDLFVVEQSSTAKKVSGSVMKAYTLLDIISATATSLSPGTQATASYNATTKVLSLGIPQGAMGETGPTGNGIASITKTGTVGRVDTYTVVYTNGSTTTFTVTNGEKGDTGSGITSITKTGTSGLVDTYTIAFDNGTSTTFTVTNGAAGRGITSITKTGTSGLIDTYTIAYTDSTTSSFTVTNGNDAVAPYIIQTVYGTTNSSSSEPATWYTTIPAVTAGNFLWTRYRWSNGQNTSICTKYGDGSQVPIDSPAFTGIPTAPTAPSGTNTTQLATTAFVQNATSGSSVGNDYDFITVGQDGDIDGRTKYGNWSGHSKTLYEDSLRRVVCGNGELVCVGDAAASYYSYDGINWIAMSGITSGEYNDLYGVCYGNGRFVCVGRSGLSYYSIDGISWTAMRGLNSSYDYHGVAYGNGIFVCVGEDSLSYYSTDGTDWTLGQSRVAYSADNNSVCYGDGRFIRVGNNSASSYSFDGITWTDMTGLSSQSNVGYYDAIYFNGTFVCVGDDGAYYSTNGTTWTQSIGIDYSESSYHGVAANDEYFICVGDNGKSYKSENGVSWTEISGLASSKRYNSICQVRVYKSHLHNFGDLLWTNASPTSEFAAQTINLDLSAYSLILVKFRIIPDTNDSTIVFASINGYYHYCLNFLNDGINRYRPFYATSSGVRFVDGRKNITYGTQYVTDNTLMVPWYIYGVR